MGDLVICHLPSWSDPPPPLSLSLRHSFWSAMASRHFEGTRHAALYARYRPATPASLIQLVCDYIRQQVRPAARGT